MCCRSAVILKLANTLHFHVSVPEESSLSGYVMAEQIKSVDYASRKVKFVEKAPGPVLNEVLSLLDACLYAPG